MRETCVNGGCPQANEDAIIAAAEREERGSGDMGRELGATQPGVVGSTVQDRLDLYTRLHMIALT